MARFRFSLFDMFWCITAFAVFLTITTLFVRNPGLKMLGVWLIVGIVVSLPAVFWRLAQQGETRNSEPFVSLSTVAISAVVVGISLPFLVGWLLRVTMACLNGR